MEARTAEELVPSFKPETGLERRLARDPELVAGLAWGSPRKGHPEGSVGAHVDDLLRRLDQTGVSGERRALLRLIALVHDSLKYRVRDWLPRWGENHHATRARRFAERYTEDERVLSAIELHDRPYAIWRRLKRTRRLPKRQFEDMMSRVADLDLFLAFVELDQASEGKNPEPLRWFREELRRRRAAAP